MCSQTTWKKKDNCRTRTTILEYFFLKPLGNTKFDSMQLLERKFWNTHERLWSAWYSWQKMSSDKNVGSKCYTIFAEGSSLFLSTFDSLDFKMWTFTKFGQVLVTNNTTTLRQLRVLSRIWSRFRLFLGQPLSWKRTWLSREKIWCLIDLYRFLETYAKDLTQKKIQIITLTEILNECGHKILDDSTGSLFFGCDKNIWKMMFLYWVYEATNNYWLANETEYAAITSNYLFFSKRLSNIWLFWMDPGRVYHSDIWLHAHSFYGFSKL